MKGVSDMADSHGAEETSAEQDVLELYPLYPEYQEQHHGIYVRTLEQAIKDDKKKGKLRNIALSGSYGSGKSSILGKVIKDLEKLKTGSTKNISLAPLASCHSSEARTDFEELSDDSSTDTQTNRIQREIVKQLLYGVDPKEVPLSRFHRIHEKSIWEKLGFSLIISLLLTLPLAIFKRDAVNEIGQFLLSLPLINKLPVNPSCQFSAGCVFCVLFLCTVLLVVCSCFLKGDLRIGQVNVGSASLKLDQGVDSYFDQYLDEIVYLFEKTKIETVIFEDLDRFESPEIFDSLRELNQILNDDPIISKQGFRREGRVIRFVYAISDTVFDDQCIAVSDDTANEEKRAEPFSRAKFFDLIISVVPFVSSNNSYQTARSTLGSEIIQIGEVGDLLEEVAGFVPDQRTWIAIRNDFMVYRRKLHINLSEKNDEDNALGLSASHLLAFLIYKNCYLADMERMREGNSKIDKIYSFARKNVAESIQEQSEQRKKLEQELKIFLDSTEADKTAFRLLQRTKMWIAELWDKKSENFNISIDEYDEAELKKAHTWKRLAERQEDSEIRIKGLLERYPRNVLIEITPTRQVLEKYLGTTIDISQLTSDIVNSRIHKIGNRIENLRTGDWRYLLNDEAGKIEFEGPGVSSNSVRKTLSQYIQDGLQEQDTLLSRLVAGGWIAQDYKLYSTVYSDEGMSRNALNFAIHNIDENSSDFYFCLNDEDVQNVLKRVRHRDNSLFGQAWMLNISILNYLLKSDEDEDKKTLRMIISYLSDLDDEAREFLLAFLSDEENGTIEVLVLLAAESCSGILVFLTDAIASLVDDETMCKFLNAVLRNLNKDVQYSVSSTFNTFIQQHWYSIDVFKGNSLEEEAAESLDGVLRNSYYSAPNLSCLNESLRKLLIKRDAYDFTRENLLCAISDWQGGLAECGIPSLNQIKDISTPIYKYIVKNIDLYLDFLKEPEYTLDFNDEDDASDVDSAIVTVVLDAVRSVHDICESKNKSEEDEREEIGKVIGRIIGKRSQSARIRRFDSHKFESHLSFEIKYDIWKQVNGIFTKELLQNDAICFTPMNLQTVFAEAEEDSVHKWLELHPSFELVDDEPNLDKEDLAVKLLNLPLDVCDAAKKESLVRSLQLGSPLSDSLVSSIDVGNRQVFDLEKDPDSYARLLADPSVITDSETAFNMIPDECWEARRAWMLRSKEFISYLSSDLLNPNEVCRIIVDGDTRFEDIRQEISEDLGVYIQNANFANLLEAAKAQLNRVGNVEEELLERLADEDAQLQGTKELLDCGLSAELCMRMISHMLDTREVSDSNIGAVRDVIRQLGTPYAQMFDSENRTLKTDDKDFISLIEKLNQYAKQVDITSEDIWRNSQKDGDATRFTVAYSSVKKLNDRINQLIKRSDSKD